jgi:hydroxymethylpyrimidine/phosphomethylpyrimidine kinase
MHGRVLIIAGSDSGGGAGIQADLKTVTALGGYGATAITALTAQNTQGIADIYPVDPDFVIAQARQVLSDLGADCIKIGMLHSAAIIEKVAELFVAWTPAIPMVIDPVMIAKSGAQLLDTGAVECLKQRLFPQASLVTPNLPEAETLTGLKINGSDAMEAAAKILLDFGPAAVLLKGGHLPGDSLQDLLVTPHSQIRFPARRIATRHTHGTGCTLASAIATGLAQGQTLPHAVCRAHAYVQEAIRTAPGYGQGQGPLNHGHTVDRFKIASGGGELNGSISRLDN